MSTIQIGELANEVMKELHDFCEVATDDMKAAVDRAAKRTRKQIKATAPVGRRGKYVKSWRTKKMDETSTGLTAVVYSTQPGLPHLLEYGHALRGGGRTSEKPHIAAAEEAGIRQFEEEIERALAR